MQGQFDQGPIAHLPMPSLSCHRPWPSRGSSVVPGPIGLVDDLDTVATVMLVVLAAGVGWFLWGRQVTGMMLAATPPTECAARDDLSAASCRSVLPRRARGRAGGISARALGDGVRVTRASDQATALDVPNCAPHDPVLVLEADEWCSEIPVPEDDRLAGSCRSLTATPAAALRRPATAH